jgi:hypothetical protein
VQPGYRAQQRRAEVVVRGAGGRRGLSGHT